MKEVVITLSEVEVLEKVSFGRFIVLENIQTGFEGDEGMLYIARKEKVDFIGKPDHRFAGKAREPAHPYDRKSGTGRGRELTK